MLSKIDAIMFFVPDVKEAAAWYANLVDAEVQYENNDYAFIAVGSIKIGFHPDDKKGRAGVCGQTAYWRVDRLSEGIEAFVAQGGVLYRGPLHTDLDEHVCMLRDPFGNTVGLIAEAL